jgi:hypothetical protein
MQALEPSMSAIPHLLTLLGRARKLKLLECFSSASFRAQASSIQHYVAMLCLQMRHAACFMLCYSLISVVTVLCHTRTILAWVKLLKGSNTVEYRLHNHNIESLCLVILRVCGDNVEWQYYCTVRRERAHLGPLLK